MDEEKNIQDIKPSDIDLLNPQTSAAKGNSAQPLISYNEGIVDSSAILKSFFPPEIFEDEATITLDSLKQKGVKGWLPLALSVAAAIIILAFFLPHSRLMSAFLGRSSTFVMSIDNKTQAKPAGGEFKTQINDIKSAFEQRQWRAVDSKSRELLFNPKATEPSLRRWLYQIRIETFIEMGRWINVQGTTSRALIEYPDFSLGHYYMALSAARLNDYATAQKSLAAFQATLKYPISAEIEEKISWLELNILIGNLNLASEAKFNSSTNLYYSTESDRIFTLFSKIEKKFKDEMKPLPKEYSSLKLNYFTKLKDFLSDSLFTKKSIVINGAVYALSDVRGAIATLQKQAPHN